MYDRQRKPEGGREQEASECILIRSSQHRQHEKQDIDLKSI